MGKKGPINGIVKGHLSCTNYPVSLKWNNIQCNEGGSKPLLEQYNAPSGKDRNKNGLYFAISKKL